MNAILQNHSLDLDFNPRQAPAPSGDRAFDFLNPDPDLVGLDDIAVALSRIQLYPGRLEQTYSLGQHLVEVARNVAQPYRLAALFSRGAAAYFGDVAHLRGHFPDLARAEERVQEAIHLHLGLPAKLSPAITQAIRQASMEVQAAEYRDLLPGDPNPFDGTEFAPISNVIQPCGSFRAKQLFRNYMHLCRNAELI